MPDPKRRTKKKKAMSDAERKGRIRDAQRLRAQQDLRAELRSKKAGTTNPPKMLPNTRTPRRKRPAAAQKVTGTPSLSRTFTKIPERTGDTPGQRAAQKGPRQARLKAAGYRPGGPGESMANPKRVPDAGTPRDTSKKPVTIAVNAGTGARKGSPARARAQSERRAKLRRTAVR